MPGYVVTHRGNLNKRLWVTSENMLPHPCLLGFLYHLQGHLDSAHSQAPAYQSPDSRRDGEFRFLLFILTAAFVGECTTEDA